MDQGPQYKDKIRRKKSKQANKKHLDSVSVAWSLKFE